MTCTCGTRAPTFRLMRQDDNTVVEASPTFAIDCPEHGLDALIAQATPGIDIDEDGGDDST